MYDVIESIVEIFGLAQRKFCANKITLISDFSVVFVFHLRLRSYTTKYNNYKILKSP